MQKDLSHSTERGLVLVTNRARTQLHHTLVILLHFVHDLGRGQAELRVHDALRALVRELVQREEVVSGVVGLVRVLVHGHDLLRRLDGGIRDEDAEKKPLGDFQLGHQLRVEPVGRILRQLAEHFHLGQLLGVGDVRYEHFEGAIGLHEHEDALYAVDILA